MNIEKIIKESIKKGSIVWKEHILEQMRSRKIKTKEIFFALQYFKIIESDYEDKPFSSFLILGYKGDKMPSHMVIGINAEDFEIYFITTYQPRLEIWEEGFERRKKR
ncbi:MAG: DUF4258 domain-containing protein [bacterium]